MTGNFNYLVIKTWVGKLEVELISPNSPPPPHLNHFNMCGVVDLGGEVRRLQDKLNECLSQKKRVMECRTPARDTFILAGHPGWVWAGAECLPQHSHPRVGVLLEPLDDGILPHPLGKADEGFLIRTSGFGHR